MAKRYHLINVTNKWGTSYSKHAPTTHKDNAKIARHALERQKEILAIDKTHEKRAESRLKQAYAHGSRLKAR
jgi:hypothetical protein